MKIAKLLIVIGGSLLMSYGILIIEGLNKIKPIFRTPHHQFKNSKKQCECIFKKEEISLPKIRSLIGDTINIEKVKDWVLKIEKTDDDTEIMKMIGRGGKFFQINESENYIAVGFLEDEGEYLGIFVYTIDKENCEILGKELLAETTAWENGYKETFSVIKNEFTLKREKNTGAKDWGDYTKWSRDTTITMITFDNKGKINLEGKF